VSSFHAYPAISCIYLPVFNATQLSPYLSFFSPKSFTPFFSLFAWPIVFRPFPHLFAFLYSPRVCLCGCSRILCLYPSLSLFLRFSVCHSFKMHPKWYLSSLVLLPYLSPRGASMFSQTSFGLFTLLRLSFLYSASFISNFSYPLPPDRTYHLNKANSAHGLFSFSRGNSCVSFPSPFLSCFSSPVLVHF